MAELRIEDQTTLIIPEGQRYHPLGAKIRRLEYQFPDRLPTTEAIRSYLKKVSEEVSRGDLSSIPTFYQDLALSTANAESFRSLDARMRQEFEETVERIVEKLMAQTMGGNELEFREKRAMAFLQPLPIWRYRMSPILSGDMQQRGMSIPFSLVLCRHAVIGATSTLMPMGFLMS